jgi:ankyrin repeat protein
LGKSGSCIKYLLAQGLTPNATDRKGNTALHIAVAEQDADIVKVLCENGCRVEAMNMVGMTPADIAESLRNTKLEMLLKRYKS